MSVSSTKVIFNGLVLKIKDFLPPDLSEATDITVLRINNKKVVSNVKFGDESYYLIIHRSQRYNEPDSNSDSYQNKITKGIYSLGLCPKEHSIEYFDLAGLKLRAVTTMDAGLSLRELYDEPEDIPDKVRILVDKAITSLHKNGYVHGDLHYENIIMKSDHSIVFVDLDLAFSIDDIPEGRLSYLSEFLELDDDSLESIIEKDSVLYLG